jgi:hypothetical protein
MLSYNSFKNKSLAEKYYTSRKLMITTHTDDGNYIIKKLSKRYSQNGSKSLGDKRYLMIDKKYFRKDSKYNFPLTTGLENNIDSFIYRTNNLEAAIEIIIFLWDDAFNDLYQVINRTNGQIIFKTPEHVKDLDIEIRNSKLRDVLKDSQNI